MKQWMLGLAMAGMMVGATGCSSDAQTPAAGSERAAAAPAGADQVADAGTASVAAAPVDGIEAVSISGAKVAQIDGDAKGERLWEIVATIRNGSTTPLPGLELVADLRIDGESHAFARNSAELRFETPLPPGEQFTWRSLSPADGKVDAKSVQVVVEATRWLEAAKVEDGGWKPLDPSTAEPKTVGEPITLPAAPPASGEKAR